MSKLNQEFNKMKVQLENVNKDIDEETGRLPVTVFGLNVYATEGLVDE